MKHILLGSILALGFGCTQRSPDAPTAEQAPERQTASGKVEITEDAVKRYVAAQKQILGLTTTFTRETLESTEKMQKGMAAQLAESGVIDERAKKFEAETAALREKSGLDDGTWQVLEDLFESLQLQRMVWRNAGGDAALAELEKGVDQQLAALPAEHRGDAGRELRKLIDDMKGQRDGVEVRKKHGDAAVELALRYVGELEPLLDELFKVSVRPR